MGCSGCSGGLHKPQVFEDEPESISRASSKEGTGIDGQGTSQPSNFDPNSVLAGRIQRDRFIWDNPGEIEDYYEFDTNLLGSGSYGSVFKCTSKTTNAVRAVKQMYRTHPRYMDWVRLEAKIMKKMDHPNIIKLFETFEDSKHVYLVMELCQGGGLAERLKQAKWFPEWQAAGLMRQILRTVAYMHKQGICHRDLKPENFLFLTKDPIERNVLKIIDFGVSCTFEVDRSCTFRDKAGTPYYTSPQVLDGRYTKACDLWSCGVIMYMLLCGIPPFPGKSDEEVWKKVARANFAFQSEAWKEVSEDAKNLIRGLMKYKEHERFSACQALNHDAIQRYAPRGKDVQLRSGIIGSLRNFAYSTKMKKAGLHAIVQTSREDQVALLRETFLTLDIDDDGFVTHDEIFTALSQAGLSVPHDLEAIVGEVDQNRTGAINYTEFIAATLDESHYLREDRCWAAFLLFDRDGDGFISQEELETTLGDPDALRLSTDPKEVSEILRETDYDGDGAISFKEFVRMMKDGTKPRRSEGSQKQARADIDSFQKANSSRGTASTRSCSQEEGRRSQRMVPTQTV